MSTGWTWFSRKSHPGLIKIQFSTRDCTPCPRRYDCVHATGKYPRRTLVIRPQAQHAALQAARQRQHTATFRQDYALRAGIEATISQGVGPLTCAVHKTPPADAPVFKRGEEAGVPFGPVGEGHCRFRYVLREERRMSTVKRAYFYRFYPTDEQKQLLARTFGCVRYVYNWALALRQQTYRETGKGLSYKDSMPR